MNRIRYSPIDPILFQKNRQALYKLLKPNSLVVLHANDIMPMNADGTYPFRQNSDLFYLSGIDQANTILLLYPTAQDKHDQEILFIKESSDYTIIWEGHQYTSAQAKAVSGIVRVHFLDHFEDILYRLMQQATHVYLNKNEQINTIGRIQTSTDQFIIQCKKQYPLHSYERLAPIMASLRTVKSPLEIDLIQQACTIVEQGFKKVLPMIKPGIMEYEIEGMLLGEFVQRGSRGFAFNPIVAAGSNACILHYEANNQRCKAGDLLLLDIGAEYANYNADVTRVIPINGRFTIRQKEVYNAVLSIMQAAQQLLVPSNTLYTYHKMLVEVIEEALIKLKLLSKHDIAKQSASNPAYKKYCMHGISHYLGLAVHDVGNIHQKFVPGVVVTVEPGIYIKEEGIGIRLENDVLIQEDGIKNLTAAIPLDADEIEACMHGA